MMGILRPTPSGTPAPVVQSAATTTHAAMTDWVGVLASVGCAIHCAAMPFVVSFLPMLGLSFLADESFHQVMVGVCLLIAVAAFAPGWRQHRRWLPIGIASVGLAMIASAAFALEGECCAACVAGVDSAVVANSEMMEAPKAVVCTDACCEHCAATEQSEPTVIAAAAVPAASSWLWLITPLGGMVLVTAHLTNHRFVCRCGCCPSEPTDLGSSE